VLHLTPHGNVRGHSDKSGAGQRSHCNRVNITLKGKKRSLLQSNSMASASLLASPTQLEGLVCKAWKFSEEYMSQPGFDASHDFNHLRRVVSLAQKIYDTSTPEFQSTCDRNVVTLLALLHDVGDKKYTNQSSPEAPSSGTVETFLLSINAPEALAAHIQHLVANVSFSSEQKHIEYVRSLAAQYPELAVVQDADRIDAIGAMGIARVITFSTAKRPQEGWQGIITHYEEKLGRLAREMKTVEGKKLAETRGERIRMFFEDWWNDEVVLPAKVPLVEALVYWIAHDCHRG